MSNIPLDNLRKEIDAVDNELISLLAKRMDIVEKIGKYKKENNIPPMDNNRWQSIVQSLLHKAEKLNLSKELVKDIYDQIHKHALCIEE